MDQFHSFILNEDIALRGSAEKMLQEEPQLVNAPNPSSKDDSPTPLFTCVKALTGYSKVVAPEKFDQILAFAEKLLQHPDCQKETQNATGKTAFNYACVQFGDRQSPKNGGPTFSQGNDYRVIKLFLKYKCASNTLDVFKRSPFNNMIISA